MAKQESYSLRKHLADLLRMKGAHLSLDEAVSDFPAALRGAKPPGAPHSAWQLLEHMRLAQEDILDFSRNPKYKEKKFPDDYWPAAEAPPSPEAWDNSIRQFQSDLKEMQELIAERRSWWRTTTPITWDSSCSCEEFWRVKADLQPIFRLAVFS